MPGLGAGLLLLSDPQLLGCGEEARLPEALGDVGQGAAGCGLPTSMSPAKQRAVRKAQGQEEGLGSHPQRLPPWGSSPGAGPAHPVPCSQQ